MAVNAKTTAVPDVLITTGRTIGQLNTIVNGHGTIATQSASSVSITGGSITGIADLAIADGGTGSGTAAGAFTNLKQAATDVATGVVELATNAEVATGSDTTRAVTPAGAASRYQPLDADLTAIAGLTSAADTLPYFTGIGTAGVTILSSYGRTLIDDADAATAQGTLGLGTMATQAASAVAITGGSVTGITDLAIADGGTGAGTAAAAFTALKQAATTTATGVVELATDGESAANVVVQGNDSRLHAAVSLAGTPDYITVAGQVITRGLIDLATDVTGDLPIADGGTGANTAATAFSNLKQAASETATGVVELATTAEVTTGTDTTRAVTAAGVAAVLHSAVTLAGSPDYITLSGQVITRALVNLASHVTGLLPIANVSPRALDTDSTTTRTNVAGDRANYVRHTSTAAKTLTIDGNVATAGDVLVGFCAGATGDLSVQAGTSMALTGNLVFAPLKGYMIYFTSATTADVIGGSA